MNTEQRLTFEAKHPSDAPMEWMEDVNAYVPFSPNDFEAATRRTILWQGYQSGLEDRQGEAVALKAALEEIVSIPLYGNGRNQYKIKQIATDALAKHASIFTSPQPAQPDQAGIPRDVLVEAYMLMEADESQIPDDPKEALEKLIDWHCEFRKAVGSVAQPDQWNAAIEALRVFSVCAGWIEDDEHDDDFVKFRLQVKDYKAAKKALDDLLALRKGA